MADIVTDTLDLRNYSIPDEDTLYIGGTPYVSTTRPDDDKESVTSKQKEQYEFHRDFVKGNSISQGLQALSLALGAASLYPYPNPAVNYVLGAGSSLASLGDTWIFGDDLGLTTSEKWARTGVDLIGLAPGGYQAYRWFKGNPFKITNTASSLATRVSSKTDELAEAQKKLKELEKAIADAVEGAPKKAADKAWKEQNDVVKKLTKELESLKSTSPASVGRKSYFKYETGRLGTNALVNGGIQYGIPGAITASEQENPGVTGYFTQGFKDAWHDVKDAAHGDGRASSNLWHYGTSILRTGAGTGNARLLNIVSTPAVVAPAATGTAGALLLTPTPAQANKSEPAPRMIYINPELGERSPRLQRKEGMQDVDWLRMFRSATNNGNRPNNGIYVYDKNNNRFILSATDSKTYKLINPSTGESRKFSINDPLNKAIFATRNGWFGMTEDQVKQLPELFPSNKRGGKLNTLKNLRYENYT